MFPGKASEAGPEVDRERPRVRCSIERTDRVEFEDEAAGVQANAGADTAEQHSLHSPA